MAQIYRTSLDISDVNATGGIPVRCDRFTHKSVQLNRLVSGTYKVQVSNDNTNWFDLGGSITSSALLSTNDPSNPIPLTVAYLRIYTVVKGDGVATFQGFDPV